MKEKFRVLDLFAGAGGFSLGFKMAGATIVGGIEIDKWAGETLACNHPDAQIEVRDIQTISDQEAINLFKKKPNIIIGGPPCQGFSVCRQGTGDEKDPKNNLFQEFVRFGHIFEPDLMIMENVPNLVKIKTQNKQPVIDVIKGELSQLGYHVDSQILNATDYGIPQIRQRLFIIASKVKIAHPFPKATHTTASQHQQLSFWENILLPCPTLWDAISDLPRLEAGEGAEVMSYSKPPQTNYQKKLRGSGQSLYNHKAMNHTKRMVERFASMSWGDSCSDVPDHLKPRKRNSNQISSRVYDQNNRRLHPSRPCHTLPASFYANFVHPYSHRNFTAREGARIQSFPDDYVFKGKPTVVSHKLLAREGREHEKFLCQYNQIGNAVPPLLAQQIALNLFEQLSGFSENFQQAV